jgi:hypothetical protein
LLLNGYNARVARSLKGEYQQARARLLMMMSEADMIIVVAI